MTKASSIKFKRGNKADLPKSAPSGTPLWCEDTHELYLGTNDGVKKVGGVSQQVDTTNALNPIGSNSDDTSQLKKNTEITMQGGSITAQTFNGNLNGNASTSTKATNDGNGNNIVSTYIPKSGGTITGNLTVNGTTNGTFKGNLTGNVTGNLSGNASSSTKATQDASGNNIESTYLKKAGGTITGNLTVNGTTTGTFSGNLSGNATSSTKATQDGSGNNIESTYLKKSGGTVTGNLTVNGTTNGTFKGNLTGNVSGNATSSTNASNDGEGNNIVQTYAKKTDLDLKLNISDVAGYITEVYTNGSSGYMIYSNGYCEQWGVADIGSDKSNSSNYAFVSLLKSYNDQYYTIQANHKEAASNNSYKLCNGTVNITNQQFSYFYIRANTTSTNDTYRYFYWRTFGYLMNNNEGVGGSGGGLGDLEDIFG